MSDHLTCKELVELVTEYLEGTLSLAEKTRFDEHIKGCKGCTTYLAQMRTTIRLMGHLTEQNIPAVARDELLDVFDDWKDES
jgi:hypothetical protein